MNHQEECFVTESRDWFAHKQSKRLVANAYKGGWRDELTDSLLDKLREEVKELVHELTASVIDEEKSINEAADVANLVFMIADNLRSHDE